jgi:predicted ATP-dependent serine protease
MDRGVWTLECGNCQRAQMRRAKEREEAAAFESTTRIATGVPGLDELVNGGYLLGSTTLIAGVSGSVSQLWRCNTSMKESAVESAD